MNKLLDEADRREYLNRLGVMVVELTANGVVDFINDAGVKILGNERKDIVAKNWFKNFIPKRMRSEMNNLFKETLAGKIGTFLSHENSVINKNGEERVILWNSTLVQDSEGVNVGLLCTGQDITDERLAEEALRESENRSRAISDYAQESILMIDDKGLITYSNKSAIKLFGYSEGELIGANMHSMIVPKRYRKEHFEAFEIFRKTGKGSIIGKIIALTLLKKSGEEFPVELSVSAVKMKGRWSAVGIIRDISERRDAEKKTRKAFQDQLVIDSILQISLKDIPLEKQLRLSLRLLLSIPWLAALSKGCVFIIDKKSKSLKLKAHIGLSNKILSLCSSVSFDKCLCGKVAVSGEVQFIDSSSNDHSDRYDGSNPHCHYVVPILSEGTVLGVINLYLEFDHLYDEGEVAFLELVANTLSGLIKRKHIEAEKEKLWNQLLQSQKMESIGRLTGGIAHDFNNLLAAIMGFGDLAIQEIAKDSPAREYVSTMIEASERATKLTQQLLAFSRKQVLEVKCIDLNELVGHLTKMLRRVIGEDIQLKLNTKAPISNVMADATQIEQILLNLTVNARHAMPNGGVLAVTTADVELDEDSINEHVEAKPGKYVMMSVKDTGTGMSKAVQEKIFEPFFTTKELGKGTGLGLSTVFGIIKQHDGYISVHSEEGAGTEFLVYFPATEKVKKTPMPIQKAESLKRGSETILTVDDDVMFQQMCSGILESLGYNVLVASSAEQALQLIKDTDTKIDLLFTDVVLTGLNGYELYEQARVLLPYIKVLFTSGYMDNQVVVDKIIQNEMPFIKKPVRAEELSDKVRDVLD